MRVKLKDVKQGKTFWVVRPFYDDAVSRYHVTSKVYESNNSLCKFLRFDVLEYTMGWPRRSALYVGDLNIVASPISKIRLNAAFTSKRSAERYLRRIKSLCFTKSEAETFTSMVCTRQFGVINSIPRIEETYYAS